MFRFVYDLYLHNFVYSIKCVFLDGINFKRPLIEWVKTRKNTFSKKLINKEQI